MADNKLLWQVELLPPTAANVKKVSQVIDQGTAAQQKATSAAERQVRATKEQSSEYNRLSLEIAKARQKVLEFENAARFNNAGMENAVDKIGLQKDSLEALVDTIDRANLTQKQRTDLLTKSQVQIKGANLAQGRLTSGFKGAAQSAGQANQTLLEMGRVLSDLPFGFIGISNNLEQSSTQFANLSRKTGGFKGAMTALVAAAKSPGGMLVMFGSMIPAALSFATIGLRNWNFMAGDSKSAMEELDDELKDVAKSFESLTDSFGDDPTGVQSQMAQVEGYELMMEQLDGIVSLVETKTAMTQTDDIVNSQWTRGIQATSASFDTLEDRIEEVSKATGFSEEAILDMKAALEENDDALQTFITRLEATPLQRFRLQNLIPLNENLERFELGLTTTAEGIGNLEGYLQNSKQAWEDQAEVLREQIDQGEEELIPYLKVVLELIKSIDDEVEDVDPSFDMSFLEGFQRPGMDSPVADVLDAMTDDIEKTVDQWVKEDEKYWAKRRENAKEYRRDAIQISLDSLSNSVSVEARRIEALRVLEEDAIENGMIGHRSYEAKKLAITRKFANEARDVEIERQQEITDAKMSMISEYQNFVNSTMSLLLGDSKAAALIELAIDKALNIGSVIVEGKRRVGELNMMAAQATAQASLAIASGNFVQADALAKAALMAQAQAGRVTAITTKTVAAIAATGLAEGAGIALGGGSSGGATSSSRAGGESNKMGFFTSDADDEDSERRVNRRREDFRDPRTGGMVVYVDNTVDEKGIATIVRRGERRIRNKRRSQQGVNV